MNIARHIPHFEQVETSAIEAHFSENMQHRAKLTIPFKGNRGTKTLCVVGQNPSAADSLYADKTIRYLEELIYRSRPEYASLVVLNLYSRIDTKKSATDDLLDVACRKVFENAVRDHDDFLIFYGRLKNHRAYKFKDRAVEVSSLVRNKNVFKLDLGTPYAPHPGNSKILYHNFNVTFAMHHFCDLPN